MLETSNKELLISKNPLNPLQFLNAPLLSKITLSGIIKFPVNLLELAKAFSFISLTEIGISKPLEKEKPSNDPLPIVWVIDPIFKPPV